MKHTLCMLIDLRIPTRPERSQSQTRKFALHRVTPNAKRRLSCSRSIRCNPVMTWVVATLISSSVSCRFISNTACNCNHHRCIASPCHKKESTSDTLPSLQEYPNQLVHVPAELSSLESMFPAVRSHLFREPQSLVSSMEVNPKSVIQKS